MAWNEPGKDKDPWGGGNRGDGPPDLDDVVKDLQKKLGGLFGGKSGKGGNGASGGGPELSSTGWTLIVIVALVLWLISGIYIVEPAERGVVLRFGAFTGDVTEPGPNWHIPWPIEEVRKVNVDQIRSHRHDAQMLTRDENIIDVELTVQSRISKPTDYLFQDSTPDKTLQDTTETAVREVIGQNKLDYILTEGRGDIADQIREGVQQLLTQYNTGLTVTSINMQPAKPPEEVKAAFDDAIKAREDKERLENEAEAYRNEIVPKARGAAARQIADAQGYRDERIAEAEGEAARFEAVLKEYLKAPEVTRERLYLEAVEELMANTGKVLMDNKGGNNLTYLPLDRIIGATHSLPQRKAANSVMPRARQSTTEPLGRDLDRSRSRCRRTRQ
jgi:membrane protease subunit HflK